MILTGTETMIVSNAYFIAGAALMLVAGVAVALSLLRVEESPPWTSS